MEAFSQRTFAFNAYNAALVVPSFSEWFVFFDFYWVVLRWSTPLTRRMIFHTFPVVTDVCLDVKPLKCLIWSRIISNILKSIRVKGWRKKYTIFFIFLWYLVSNFGDGISPTTSNGLKRCSYWIDSTTFTSEPVLLHLQTWQPHLGGVKGQKPLGCGR